MIDLVKAKVRTLQEASAVLAGWRIAGAKIVFTNGCFDLMHPGHLHYLAEARQLGKYLIVGLNSDDQSIPNDRSGITLSQIDLPQFLYAFEGFRPFWTLISSIS